MIKIMVGGVGSGKSVSLARYIYSRPNPVYVNFHIYTSNARRLLLEHLIHKEVVGIKKSGEEITKQKVNYAFWKERLGEECDIVIDEAHNILMSRMSQSKNNVLISQWIAQIRKILGTSKKHDIILATQRIGGIDTIPRDLSNHIIACESFETDLKIPTKVIKSGKVETLNLPETIIIHRHFVGEECLAQYLAWKEWRQHTYRYKTAFVGNPFFQLFDSYALIDFGEEAYL